MPDDEEKLQLQADVERYKRMIRQKDEMIEDLEHELSNHGKTPVSDGKTEARERELNGQIRDLQLEIDGKDATIVQRNGVIDELREEIEKLEKSSRELANRSEYQDSDESNSFLEHEMVRISEELEKYKEATGNLFEQNSELKKNVLQLQEENENAMEHVKSLESHLKTREEQIASLESELFDLKNSSRGKHASSGNSIFAEAMEAERKLEGDLRNVFTQNQALSAAVRRLTLEKEDAEERARSAMNRGLVVRTAINHIDIEEMRRLRERVHELELERTHCWERLFIKMKTVPKRELGALVAGYFESFKCSIVSVKSGQAELLKKNEQYVTTIRGLQQENENQHVKIEQLQFDIESLTRKLKSSVNATNSEPAQLRAPLKPIDNSRPSFFVRPKPVEVPVPTASMSNMHVTPQKPANLPNTCSTAESKNENTSYWADRQKVKAEKKAATPAARYNFVTLTEAKPKFKPATLMMPSTPKEE